MRTRVRFFVRLAALAGLAFAALGCGSSASGQDGANGGAAGAAGSGGAAELDAGEKDASGDAAAVSDASPADADDGGTTRWPACNASATSQRVTFVHMNDMHGHYNQTPGGGPTNVARIRGFFNQVRQENPYTLFTNGGDDYEKGSVVEPLSQYAATQAVSAALDFDVRVIGNHDFAWSQQQLLDYTRGDRAIVLASNIKYIGSDPSKYGAVQYAELTVGCVKIGFIGAVSGPWDDENNPVQGDYYKEFPTDLDFVSVHRDLIAAHRKDVDLMVAVSHLGVSDDLVVGEQAPGLDFILGGHSHTPIFQPEMAGATVVIQAGSYSAYAARLDVNVDLVAHKVSGYDYTLKLVSSALAPPDDAAEKKIEGILAQYGAHAFDPVGHVKGSLSTLEASRLAVEGAILKLGVDAAAMKSSAAFNGILPGARSQQDLFNAFLIERQPPGTPGWTSTWTVSINGADLAKLGQLSTTDWAFTLPATIDPSATYTLSLPRFAATHPDKYLPAGVTVSNATFAVETWELLDALAREREKQCLYLDTDDALPGCTP